MAKRDKFSKETYKVSDWQALYTEFYEYFDFEYWRYKLSYLNYLLESDLPGFELADDESFDLVRLHRYVHQEIHFSYNHILECMFALLFAESSELPPWLYLTVYTNQDLYEAADLLSAGKYQALFGVDSFEDFIVKAVYGGLPIVRDTDEWRDHVAALEFIFKSFLQDFRSGKSEYNSYKHGLRVCNLKTSMTLRFHSTNMSFSFNNVASSVFLKTKKEPDGRLSVMRVANGFNPKRDLEMAHIGFHIMKSTYSAFRAKQDGSHKLYIRGFSSADVESLQSLDIDLYSSAETV